MGKSEKFITPEEAASILGVSKNTIYRRIKDGTLFAKKIPGKSKPKTLISRVSLDLLHGEISTQENGKISEKIFGKFSDTVEQIDGTVIRSSHGESSGKISGRISDTEMPENGLGMRYSHDIYTGKESGKISPPEDPDKGFFFTSKEAKEDNKTATIRSSHDLPTDKNDTISETINGKISGKISDHLFVKNGFIIKSSHDATGGKISGNISGKIYSKNEGKFEPHSYPNDSLSTKKPDTIRTSHGQRSVTERREEEENGKIFGKISTLKDNEKAVVIRSSHGEESGKISSERVGEKGRFKEEFSDFLGRSRLFAVGKDNRKPDVTRYSHGSAAIEGEKRFKWIFGKISDTESNKEGLVMRSSHGENSGKIFGKISRAVVEENGTGVRSSHDLDSGKIFGKIFENWGKKGGIVMRFSQKSESGKISEKMIDTEMKMEGLVMRSSHDMQNGKIAEEKNGKEGLVIRSSHGEYSGKISEGRGEEFENAKDEVDRVGERGDERTEVLIGKQMNEIIDRLERAVNEAGYWKGKYEYAQRLLTDGGRASTERIEAERRLYEEEKQKFEEDVKKKEKELKEALEERERIEKEKEDMELRLKQTTDEISQIKGKKWWQFWK